MTIKKLLALTMLAVAVSACNEPYEEYPAVPEWCMPCDESEEALFNTEVERSYQEYREHMRELSAP